VTVSPLFDEQTLHGAICLFTDLTAVKDLEEQLRLKESLAAVGELTAGIAHEFRNSLATIQGYSKLFDLNALPPVYRPMSKASDLRPNRSTRSSPTSSPSHGRHSSP
jgi:Signal transduction histidine kinase